MLNRDTISKWMKQAEQLKKDNAQNSKLHIVADSLISTITELNRLQSIVDDMYASESIVCNTDTKNHHTVIIRSGPK